MELSKSQSTKLDRIFDEVVECISDYAKDSDKEGGNQRQTSKYIPRPSLEDSNGHSLMIGDLAKDKLIELYAELRDVLNCNRVISLTDIAHIVDPLFSSHIFNEGEQFDDISQFALRVEQEINSGCKDTTIVVPFISSSSEQTQQELRVGDVRIISKDLLKNEFTSPLRRTADDLYQQEYEETAERYERFLWHIVVPIRGIYTDSLAEELAIDVAKLILNMFHIRIGKSHSYKMSVGFGLSTDPKSAVIKVLNDGKVTFKERCSLGLGNVGLPDDFLSIFKGKYQEVSNIIGISANLMLDVRKSYPLNQRLVDALYWHGDAVREQNKAVSTVKFITALERLLTFNEQTGIKSRVCNRAIALIRHWEFEEEASLPHLKASLVRVYQLRSDIVHGSISPRDTDVGKKMEQIEELSRCVLHCYAQSISHRLNEVELKVEADIKKWLVSLVERYGIAQLPTAQE